MLGQRGFGIFRMDRQGIRKVLGDLEAEIMELVWKRPPNEGTTVREIFEVLYARRHLAYTTIMNTMTRLAKKGLLRAEKSDVAYVYFPTQSQEEFVASWVGDIVEDLMVNFSGATLERLAALSGEGTAARIAELAVEIERQRTAEEPAEGVAEPHDERDVR